MSWNHARTDVVAKAVYAERVSDFAYADTYQDTFDSCNRVYDFSYGGLFAKSAPGRFERLMIWRALTWVRKDVKVGRSLLVQWTLMQGHMACK